MLLGKNAGSTGKGWYWYDAMWERESVCFFGLEMEVVKKERDERKGCSGVEKSGKDGL